MTINYSKKNIKLILTAIFVVGFLFSTLNLSTAWACCCPPAEPTYAISGIKFNDENGNGFKDCSVEPGLPGWTITLEGGELSTSTITNGQGYYKFSDLSPGFYTLCEVQQEGWQQTYPTENNGCHLIEIENHNKCKVNFGNQLFEPEPVCPISGIKFHDQNENGINDEEPGLQGWIITLEGPEQFSTSTTTDEDGYYCFESVVPGDYRVEEILQAGWTNSTPLYQDITLEDEPIIVDFGNYQVEEPEPYCGDGDVGDCEECDEGENNGLVCTPEYGSICSYCSLDCQIIELTGPYCGDGILDEGYETCDDGNNIDGDGCSAVCHTEEPGPPLEINPGDIVINEIMQNPAVVPDCNGEWFELYNATSSPLDLNGCLIKDNGTDSHTIATSSLIIPAGGYLVLARDGDTSQNGSTTPDYVYSNFVLGNEDDEIILECNSIEIDRVEYDDGVTFPDPDGASMILAQPSLDNNLGSNWCESSSSYGLGNLGTPGAQNDSCYICTDDDGDGYAVEGGDCGPIDCVDTDENINPDATEICDNQIDDDCDGYVDDEDTDCQAPTPECETGESQSCDTGQLGVCAEGTKTCQEDGFWDECLPDNQPSTEICDNGLDDDCDGYVDSDDSDCFEEEAPPAGPLPSIGGGGGSGPVGLIIFNEKNEETLTNTATVSWFTNQSATSRVIYDTISHSSLTAPPNYGYASSTLEDSDKVTFHTVVLTGLHPCKNYYWLAISRSSPEVWGDEMVLGTECPLGGVAEEEIIEEKIVEKGPPEEEVVEVEEVAEKIYIVPEAEIEEKIKEEPQIEEIVEEVEEEKIEEEIKEEKPTGFLAAMANIFQLENFCWFFFILIIILVILYLLSKVRKERREIKEEKKRWWWTFPLIIFILVILYWYFCCLNCWVLLLAIIILILLSLLFRKK